MNVNRYIVKALHRGHGVTPVTVQRFNDSTI